MTDRPDRPSASSRPDLLDPGALSRLGGLEFVSRAVVEGFLMGLHRSPHRGFSAEFAELRAYQPGDDLRYIDWRMYGRSDRFFVKQFEEETNLRAYVLLDVSASMGWSSRPEELPTKLWYAKLLAACLSLILLRQGDAVGLTTFHDRAVTRMEARSGRGRWNEILRALEGLEASGGTRAHEALKRLASRLRRRGLVFLLSDLLVDVDETRTALRYLRHQGHEILVFHLLDPGERELRFGGATRFVDPESGQEMQVDVPALRDEYRTALSRALEEWRRSLRPHGIDHVVVDTGEPLARFLREYLRKRERLG